MFTNIICSCDCTDDQISESDKYDEDDFYTSFSYCHLDVLWSYEV